MDPYGPPPYTGQGMMHPYLPPPPPATHQHPHHQQPPQARVPYPFPRRGLYNDVRLELAESVTDPYTQQPRQPFNNQGGYMPNGAPGGHPGMQPAPGATPLLPNQGRVIQTGPIRVLCIADVRGKSGPPNIY